MVTYLTYTDSNNSYPKKLDLPVVPAEGNTFNISETIVDESGSSYDAFTAFTVLDVTFDFNTTTKEMTAGLLLEPQ